MRFALQLCADIIGIPLEVLVISAMLRGAYRRFPFAFAYMLAFFLATLTETSLFVLATYQPRYRSTYTACFWVDETILFFLVFAVVVSLIYKATETAPARHVLRLAVLAVAPLIVVITFAIHYEPGTTPGTWMTPWTSNLNFCAAVLDLALWTMTISLKKPDRLILMLSGALGIQFAGEAIGESIRVFAVDNRSRSVVLLGNLVIVAFNLVFLYFWWQAFRRPESTLRAQPR